MFSIWLQDELKTLAKHVSCKCKCKFAGKMVIQINSVITTMSMRMQKNICERDHICDSATCSCKKGNYL